MDFMMGVRSLLIRERFLNYGELRRRVEARYPILPRSVAEALKALERMVSSVNMLLTAALATHVLLTLADLEQFILTTSKDFEGCTSFDDLKLGPLHTHPEWQRICPKSTADSSLRGEEVVRYLAVNISNAASAHEPFSPTVALDALAVERGFVSHRQLGVYLRAESWITFAVSRAKMVGANAEKKIKRQLASELKKGQNENGPRAQEKVDSSEVALQEAFEAVACADVSLHPTAHPSEGQFWDQLRAWILAPPSAGSTLIFPDLDSTLRKTVYRRIEASEDLINTVHLLTVGPKTDRILILRRGDMDTLLGASKCATKTDKRVDDTLADEGIGQLAPPASADEDAEAMPANGDAVLRALQSLLEDLAYVESPGARLAAAEERLLADFDVDLFDELRLAEPTLAAFCRTHCADVDPLLFSAASAVSGGPSASAAEFASAMLTRLPRVRDSVLEYAMRTHFGVDSMSVLGWRSVSDLRLWLKQHSAVAPDGLPCALVIAATNSKFDVSSSIHASREDALALFDALPPLTDVALGMQWQTVHLARLGSLASFLVREKLPIIEVSHGSFVKLEVGAIPHFEDALQRQQATRAVALATHLCVKAGGIELAPIELMRDCMAAAAKDLSCGASARLVVQCAAALRAVWPLRPALFSLVFWDGLQRVLPEAWRQMACVASEEELAALRVVAQELGRRDLESALNSALKGDARSNAAPAMPEPERANQAQQLTLSSADRNEPERTQPPTAIAHESPGMHGGGAAHSLLPSSTADGVSADTERSCSELCAYIRKRFGIGLDTDESLDAGTRSAFQEVRGGFQRSIHRLAEELYAGSAHFVLELIQNADDNRYAEGATPALHITVAADRVRFDNNELGFTEKNVLSLCNIGQSTKAGSDPRYIGNKGIGWKSVFKISSTPEVHSRSYHLRFDSNDTSGLGYICPEPIAPPAGWHESSGTAIILPVASAVADAAIRDFELAMGRMQPVLLLFLHQLEWIHITLSGGMTRSLRRRSDEDDTQVIILEEQQHNHISRQRFLVVTRCLAPVVARGNATVLSTELTIAFPLPESADTPAKLPFMDVFAFLPLRSYGFAFVLQADWEVPSSRESIDASSAWNQWLRDETPTLFLDAAGQLLARAVAAGETCERVQLVNLLFQLVPLHASEFFSPLAEECCQSLRSCECVPTREGGMCCPREAVLPSVAATDASTTVADEHVARTTERLIQSVGLKYAVSGLHMPEELGTALGLKRLDAKLLTTLLSEASSQWQDASQVDAKWLVWALQEIRRDPQSARPSALSALRRLRILPLRGGSIGCAQLASGDSAGAIFELGRGVELTAEEQQLSTLFSGVRLVDSVFSYELASSRDASSLLVQLGVLQLSSDDFLRSHVISALANEQTPPTELPLLFHLARRLAPHTRSLRSHALARCLLDARAQLLASDGSVCRLGECLALHLSCELEPSLTYVPAELPAGWLVLDRAYVQAEADLVSLKSLLLTLGLADFPAIVQSTPSAVVSTSSAVVSTDWASPSCDALLAALCAAGDLKRLKQFAAALSERWPVLSQRATRGAAPSSVPSAFALSLRRHAWLVGSDGELHRPQELWTRTRELEDILGASGAVWVTASFSDDLASVLGVRTCLSADLAISLLTLWAAEPKFISTIDQMAAMLRWLKPVVEADEAVRAALHAIRCIWLPDRSELELYFCSKKLKLERKVPSGRVTGRFYAPSECVRQDPAGLVDSFKQTVTEEVVKLVARAGIRCLSSYYEGHGLERFFEVVGVAAEPQLEHLVAILTAAGESGEPCATSLTAVYRVFGSLAFSDQEQRREHDDLQEDEEDEEEEAAGGRVAQRKRDLSIGEQIAQAVGEAAVFPTANGRWSRLSDVYFFSSGSLIEDAAVRWSALANAHALECRPPGPPYDAHRLKQLHKSENRPENFVKDLEANLLTFYSNVLQLQPIARFVRQAISASDAYAVPVNSSLRVCAAAGVLQRWSASALSRSAQQREALQASLASLRLYHATAITVHDELTTPLGDLLESSSGGAPNVFLRRGDGMPELFLTSTATPRAFVHEMAKLLPEPVQRAEAAMAMMTLIESIWSWETLHSAISADMLHSALCGTDHGLGDMPMIAASELWLSWNSSAGTGAVASLANASSEAEKRPLKETSVADLHTAMEREQALLSRWNGADEVGDVVGAFEAGPADVDVALAASLSRLKELRNLPRVAPNLLGNVYAGLGGAFVNAHDNAGLVGAASGGGAGVSVGASGGVGNGDGGNCGGRCSGDGDCAGGSGGGGSGGGGSSGIRGGEPSINHSTHDFPLRIDVDAWETLCVQPTIVQAMAVASSVERQMSTGHWGEQLVARHLRKTLASAMVTWVNEEEERGLPYDIVVTELGGAIGSRNDSYVEVKATSSADKPLFEMSIAELEFARAHGAAYSLYRVFNANSEHVRVLKLHNVARSLTNGGLVLFAGAAPAPASSLTLSAA